MASIKTFGKPIIGQAIQDKNYIDLVYPIDKIKSIYNNVKQVKINSDNDYIIISGGDLVKLDSNLNEIFKITISSTLPFIAIDENDNIFFNYSDKYLKKYDKNGNLLQTQNLNFTSVLNRLFEYRKQTNTIIIGGYGYYYDDFVRVTISCDDISSFSLTKNQTYETAWAEHLDKWYRCIINYNVNITNDLGTSLNVPGQTWDERNHKYVLDLEVSKDGLYLYASTNFSTLLKIDVSDMSLVWTQNLSSSCKKIKAIGNENVLFIEGTKIKLVDKDFNLMYEKEIGNTINDIEVELNEKNIVVGNNVEETVKKLKNFIGIKITGV